MARSVVVGDIVRDRRFPKAIDRVTGLDAMEVYLAADFHCLQRHVDRIYEHADGAPILPLWAREATR